MVEQKIEFLFTTIMSTHKGKIRRHASCICGAQYSGAVNKVNIQMKLHMKICTHGTPPKNTPICYAGVVNKPGQSSYGKCREMSKQLLKDNESKINVDFIYESNQLKNPTFPKYKKKSSEKIIIDQI